MNNKVDHLVTLSALGWEPLKAERKEAKAKLMFKLLNKMCPKILPKHFTYKSEMSNYDLRDISCTLCLPQPRTNNMKRSFMFNGAYIWNSLPKIIRKSKSFPCFKSKIATHIFDNNI